MKKGGVLVAVPVVLVFFYTSGSPEAAPNVLLLVSDDHSAFVFGAYGNPIAPTPNLDRLADGAVRFDRAFVNCPMCTPSRQSLLTGRLPHSIGVTQLRTALGEDPVTLAELLKSAGYDTAAIGKMHFNSRKNHGFDLRIDKSDFYRYRREHPSPPIPSGIPVLPKWRPFKDPAAVWLNGSYVPYPALDKDMPSTWLAEKAKEFLEKSRENPFFLVFSPTEPHSPFHFPLEDAGTYNPAGFVSPKPGPEDDWQIPEIFRSLTDDEKRGIIASYYTSVKFLDRNMGRVLKSLESSGHAEDTLIVYVGDHGYHLGHHGRFEKHCHYERVVRTPLVIRPPGYDGKSRVVSALVEFIDIFPTIAEYCGVKPPAEVEGRSLVPLIDGTRMQGRKCVFSEYLENEEAMIRTPSYKYIYTSGKRERQDGYRTGRPPERKRILFDLAEDPEEMRNVASLPEYADIVERLEKEMIHRFRDTFPAKYGSPPPGLDGADLLDWYLTPRDEFRGRCGLAEPPR